MESVVNRPAPTLPQGRRQGQTLLVVLMLSFLLVALSGAQFAVVQKNTRQSSFFTTHSELRHYASSGIHISLHDLRHSVTGNLGNLGKIGSTLWTPSNDVGRDGIPATGDFGEGDGFPTPGEPNLTPVTTGPQNSINLIVWTEDTAYPDVKHVVATAYNSESHATVEVFADNAPLVIPKVGAVYMDPDVALDVRGDAFQIDGNDTNPDGTAGPDVTRYGITTVEGDPAGTHETDIADQIDSDLEDQVIGAGGSPSVGEVASLSSIESLFDKLARTTTNQLDPGTFSDPILGTPVVPEITMVTGDITLSGDGSGFGVLLVDGNLTMTGAFQFSDIVIVRGDVRQTGGDSTAHVFGTLMVQDAFSVIDENELRVTGTTDIYYCSTVIDTVNG